MSALHVCIIGLKCYDHIAAKPVPRYLGGIETQLTVLARGLASEGCHVSLITYDHGQTDGEWFDGVRVVKSYQADRGVRIVRTIHPRFTSLWAAMRRANANIYLQMGAGDETGRVAFACRTLVPRRRFVFCLASDANYKEHLNGGLKGWESKAYKFGLRYADLIVAQTDRQRDGLRRAAGLNSIVMPMAATPAQPHASGVGGVGKPRIAWVGRISPEKRIEWLFEIARRCPEFIFDVAGAPNRPSDYSTRALEQAKNFPNVIMHGRLGPHELNALYAGSKLLCNTSLFEGFPTTFLEAWSHGIPVVSTFDSEIVAKNGLGRIASNVDGIVAALRELVADGLAYEQMSKVGARYYAANYAVPVVARRFREAFERLVNRGKRGKQRRR